MIPHIMTLFKFICVQYQFHRQTLPVMKIDRGQIQFREYASTGTEPNLEFLVLFSVLVDDDSEPKKKKKKKKIKVEPDSDW